MGDFIQIENAILGIRSERAARKWLSYSRLTSLWIRGVRHADRDLIAWKNRAEKLQWPRSARDSSNRVIEGVSIIHFCGQTLMFFIRNDMSHRHEKLRFALRVLNYISIHTTTANLWDQTPDPSNQAHWSRA
jgi:hypothetical protein